MDHVHDSPGALLASNARELRLRADNCRRIATRILDPDVAAELRELADHLEAQAREMADGGKEIRV
jgi:hypothetical protein